MRTITLNRMQIANFKGIQDLEVTLNGKNALISGYNGVGKSTIADAYLWAVTGKNTVSATRFEVRPRDEQGNEIHNVNTSVECEFSVVDENCDAFTFTVKRVELEDLTKKECEQLKPETIAKKKSFYFIDNAPFGEKIFYEQLAKIICDKDKLAVLSNPFAFFALDESKQREMLTAACGDVADSDIEGYAEVKEICGAINTPTDVRDGLKKSIKAMEKCLAEIPARISGLAELCDEYVDYDRQIAELEKQRSDVEEQGKSIREQELKSKFDVSPIMLPQPPSNRKILEYEYKIKGKEQDIAAEEKVLEIIEKSIRENVCPKCGYDMGSRAAEKPLCEHSILENQNDLLAYRVDLEQAKAEYDAAVQEYNAKVAEQAKADEKALQERQECEKSISVYRQQYTELSVEISKLRQAKDTQAKIKALRDEQRTLDAQYADDMTKLDKVTAFIMRKAPAVVENINKRFSAVKFKLFEMQTNGELKQCCKAMKDGVSYANINTASKVQVGIELANLFSEYLGVVVPLWVDSRESIIDLPLTKAQTICLKVDEQYKELHIEAV